MLSPVWSILHCWWITSDVFFVLIWETGVSKSQGTCWGLTSSIVPKWHKAWFKARQPAPRFLVLSGSCLSLIDYIGPGVLNTYCDWPRAECNQADGLLHSHNFSGSSQSPWIWVAIKLILDSSAGAGPSIHCCGPKGSGLFPDQTRTPRTWDWKPLDPDQGFGHL